MKLLALETSTEACSLAILDGTRVFSRFEIAPRGHAARILPWTEALLKEADIARHQLDAIATGCGPGAFTGVRLGISLAQGLALALNRPLIGVSTLATLAMRARAPEGAHVLAAIDARMRELYWCSYRIENGLPLALHEAQLGAPDSIMLPDVDEGWHAVGSGLAAQENALLQHLGSRIVDADATALPDARDMLQLARHLPASPPEYVEPVYLRDNVALTLTQQAALRQKKTL